MNEAAEKCSLGRDVQPPSLILDIHVMVSWHLSKQGICWPVPYNHVAGSSFMLQAQAHPDHMFFWSWWLTKCWFSIRSQAHVRLNCCKLGQVVCKLVNTNPGLVYIFLVYKCFPFFFHLRMLRLFKLKTEGQTICRKPHFKGTISNQNSHYQASNNPAQDLCF